MQATIGVKPSTKERVNRMTAKLSYIFGRKVTQDEVVRMGLYILEGLSNSKLRELGDVA